jgi:hypothetical protein
LKPRLGDLVSPSYPVFRHLEQHGIPQWGTVVAERGVYVDVMWSNGKVEEFWTEQDLTVHVKNSEENVAQGCPSLPE